MRQISLFTILAYSDEEDNNSIPDQHISGLEDPDVTIEEFNNGMQAIATI